MSDPPRHYLIWRNGGGFNSILSGVLGHLRIAELLGLIPVVDMSTHPTTYSEQEPVMGTSNMWEYYFEPVSSVSLDDLQHSDAFVDSGGMYPFQVMDPLFADTPWLPTVYDKYVRLRQETSDFIEKAREDVGVSQAVLGVHFRGTDMRRALHHPAPPTKQQIFCRIDHALDNLAFDRLFLVTEGENYLKDFTRRYGQRIRFLDVARSGSGDVYKQYPRENHRYRLGLEVLTETSLLSECGGLVCGFSGVSEMAQVLSRGRYSLLSRVWNGRVVGGKLGSRFLWSYRSRAPRFCGGFGL